MWLFANDTQNALLTSKVVKSDRKIIISLLLPVCSNQICTWFKDKKFFVFHFFSECFKYLKHKAGHNIINKWRLIYHVRGHFGNVSKTNDFQEKKFYWFVDFFLAFFCLRAIFFCWQTLHIKKTICYFF